VQDFADSMSSISHLATQPPVADLWYDDPRNDTKDWLAERGWAVDGADLLDKAANEYGRPLRGLPPVFERLLRDKFFTATRNR
jgi:O-methyltransferase involved in polyketide biosynthesis